MSRKIKILVWFVKVFSVRIMSGVALAGVLLAASLVAPVALSVGDVAALGEGEAGFVAEWSSVQSAPVRLVGVV